MRILKYLFGLSFLLVMAVSCKKEKNDDISFVGTATLSDKLNALFEITQDNSGMVTITPNGEGVSYYEIVYGDGTVVPAKVFPGKNTTHKYAEGLYNVKVIAHNITGKTTEFSKQLTVTFRVPENLDFTVAIDPNNNYKVNVTASATYETNFKVYFGDVPNEVPVTFNEGTTISHVYAAVGTYSVKVIAYSGGAATTQLIKTVTIVDPVLLPITFESATINYVFGDFGGGVITRINNPQINGINTSAKVGRMVKNPNEVWAGSLIALSAPIDFTAGKIFRMKVFSPRVGAKVLLKVENATNGAISYEKEVATTVANAWEDLVFDYSAINTTNSYHKVVLIFDLGTPGDGSANFTFLFDDIRLVNSLPLELPLDFESGLVSYPFTGFDGGNVTVIANPQSSGINTSAKVARMVKSAGQTWGGAFISLTNPINFSVLKTFKMKVYSPRIGAKVLLKVENLTNGAVNYEKEVLTTVANAWQELSFDYTAIPVANSYQKIVLIFDNGIMGDGTANYTFLIDDIKLN